MKTAVGFDLGGTQIKGVVVNAAGEVLRRELRPTPEAPGVFAEAIRDLATELGPTFALGLAAPGLAAKDGRSIAYLPDRLQGLEGLDWTDFLGQPSPVPVLNDAQASLLGEAWIGAARGFENAVMLTLGTGVGGAVLVDGRLLRGHIGRAGHVGHTCLDLDGAPSIAGMPGALEVFCGNYNIRERSSGRFASTHELLAAVQQGDDEAKRIWLRSIHALACGIASLINVLDPEAVILGGGIAQAGDLVFDPLAFELARVEWRPGGHAVKLLPATLGEWAGAIGAAKQALDL